MFDDIQKLVEIRGKFKEGTRTFAVHFCAIAMKAPGTGTVRAGRRAPTWARDFCKPRLESSKVDAKLRDVLGKRGVKKIKNQTFADWLKITTDEAHELKCKTAESGQDQPEKAVRRKHQTEKRRALISDIRSMHSELPSVRKMVALLKARGIEAAVGTVQKDYGVLGLRQESSGQNLPSTSFSGEEAA